jgi:hypothetical protein
MPAASKFHAKRLLFANKPTKIAGGVLLRGEMREHIPGTNGSPRIGFSVEFT